MSASHGHQELAGGCGLAAVRYRERPVPRDPPPAEGLAERELAAGDPVTVEGRMRRVDELDLDPIVYKLMHAEQGETSLTLARADQDVALYRCFLKLCVLHPGVTIVPTRQIDHVWHTHMLDTAKYRSDCDWLFGHFMDHFPYAGLRGEADRRAWLDDFARTCSLFEEHFGVEIGAQPAASACRVHGDGSDCFVGCVKPAVAGARPRPERGPAS